MKIVDNLEEWRTIRKKLNHDIKLGFVPTMGNLHIGHLSLVNISQQENHYTVASIFVNPTQFNNPEDLENYPRTLEEDLILLRNAKVNYCLLPAQAEIYQDNYNYQIHETNLNTLMEGQKRPGHFHGTLTIVMKLLNLVKPTAAYFGEKDYQQFLLIQEMVKAFFMDTKIKVCPTIRENDGLAYSSRNSRLSLQQRRKAKEFVHIFHQSHKSCETLIKELNNKEIMVDYVEEYLNRRFAAIFIDHIRLIDNYLI